MHRHWGILTILGSIAAHAAAIDCSKSNTPQEIAICSSPELKAAEDRMAAAYRVWLTAAPDATRAGIRQSQQAWLRNRSLTCNPTVKKDLTQCLLLSENRRTEALQHMVLNRGGVLFVWRSITLTARDEPKDSIPPEREVIPGYGSLTASVPQSATKAPAWNAWNKATEAAALKMSQAGMSPPRSSEGSWAAQPGVDMDINIAMGLVEPQLVTATISYLCYGHGAHPNHGSIELNWMLDKQRELRTEDVFKTDSNWADTLQNRTDAYLHKQLDQDGKSYEGWLGPGEVRTVLHGIVIDPQNWHLDGRGLSIVFQPYAVACYACTPPPFTISWADLMPLLNPDFAIPSTGKEPKR